MLHLEQGWQYMWKRKIEARSCNHCCSGKAIGVTYSECVSVAVGIYRTIVNAPYCHLLPSPLYKSFPHLLLNGRNFEKKKMLLNTKCVFWFPIQRSSESFLIHRRNERVMMEMCIGLHVKCRYDGNVYRSSCEVPLWWKCVSVFMWSTVMVEMCIGLHVKYRYDGNVYRSSCEVPLFLSDFNETWIFCPQFFEKFWNVKFHEIPSSGNRVVPRGQTDGHDETNSRFSQFWERA